MKVVLQRRGTGIAGIATILLLVTAGCTSGGSATISSSARATLHMLGSEPLSVYKPMITGFEARNPGISVDYTPIPFAQYTSVLQQRLSAKDSSFDMYAVDQPTIASFAARGYLQRISQLATYVRNATVPGLYQVNVWNGTLWAVPISTSSQFLFYNSASLARAHVAPPPSNPAKPWTWEQAQAAAQKAQQAGAEWGLILEQTNYYYQLQPLAESLGGGSGLTGPDNLTSSVSTTAWVKAFTFYHSLFSEKISPRGVNSFQTAPLFSEGKVALFVGGPWDVGNFAAAKGLGWGVAAMPYFEGGTQVTPTGGWSVGINPASPNKTAALKFLEYAASSAGDLQFTKSEANIPANKTAFNDYLPTFATLGGKHSTDVSTILEYQINHTGVDRPVSVGYTQFETIMDQAFSDISDGASPAGRLQQAQQELTRQLAADR